MLCEDSYTHTKKIKEKREAALAAVHPIRSRKPVLAFHTTNLNPVVH
jgi:hypothetical protein